MAFKDHLSGVGAMHRVLPGLALVVALAIAALSLVAIPSTSSAPFLVHASAVNLNLSYSDPASDVAKLWTSNNSHVTDAAGFWILSPSPGEVNLIRLSSSDAGATVDLALKVQTAIASRANVSYEIRMYSRADNRTHYIIDYSNGLASLKQNKTGVTPVNMTANVTNSPTSTLNVAVSKALLGGPTNITAWNIDATAREIAGNYTYEDFIWQQPGNPGSAPAFIQGRVTDAATGGGLANVNVSTGGGGFFTTTNATGYYSLPASPGNFTLTFSLAGYDSATKTVTVQYQQTQTVNAALSKTSAVPTYLPWILIIVVIVAVALIAVVLLRRRKKPSAPNERVPNPPAR
jgi:hypothetical protein